MPNIRAEAWRCIERKLESEMNSLTYKLRGNKCHINKLANEQKIIKKQIAFLGQLLRQLPQRTKNE